MREQSTMSASPHPEERSADESSPQGQPDVSGGIVIRDPSPPSNVLPGLAMGSLVAAILMSLLIAITRGETTPLYITWIAALVMAMVFGLVAAVPRVRSWRRPRNREQGAGEAWARRSL
ncbi:MAG: hypothetical protein ACRDJF_09610 [Actinomycetota bacterium]